MFCLQVHARHLPGIASRRKLLPAWVADEPPARLIPEADNAAALGKINNFPAI
jgi:hypothetical protein